MVNPHRPTFPTSTQPWSMPACAILLKLSLIGGDRIESRKVCLLSHRTGPNGGDRSTSIAAVPALVRFKTHKYPVQDVKADFWG
jgi:hypothetical protein